MSEDRFVDWKRFQELLFVIKRHVSLVSRCVAWRRGWMASDISKLHHREIQYLWIVEFFEWLTLEYSMDDYLCLQCAICLMAFDKMVSAIFDGVFVALPSFFCFKLFLTFTNDGKT